MRLALLCVIVLAGCRTRPFDLPPETAPPVDAAMSSDLARAPCLVACDRAIALCVFLNRGDCSAWACVPRTGACGASPTCDCLGADFCAAFGMGGETLTCAPADPGIGADVTCVSTLQCV